jgi:hypothetical protein
MADMKEVCGAWKKDGRSGAYYSGKVKDDIVIPAGSYINIFQNKDATEENRKPQLRVLFSEPEGHVAPQNGGSRGSYPVPRQSADLDDDIPF